MNIGIIGGGQVGQRLAALAQYAGHNVVIGLRAPDKAEVSSCRVDSIAHAAGHGELVILAIPYSACASALPPLSSVLTGKVVVDATNPLQPDWSPLLLGEKTSAAESNARLLPSARVVKAFNMVFAEVMTRENLRRGNRAATVFIAGDDSMARETVSALAQAMGFAPVVAGGLAMSRHLESLAHLNIALAVAQAGGTNAAFLYDQVKRIG
jgi:8-hydroxy-5-deazaflavin:NADPH oxidoreductase